MPKNKIRVYTKDRGVVDVKVAPNQKVVEVHKEKFKSVMNIQLNRKAQVTLSLQAYALYMHFMCNIHGYRELLSPEQISKTTALGEKAYYKAVKELIEKKYLVKVENTDMPNYYVFYEDPSLHKKENPSEASPDESDDESSL